MTSGHGLDAMGWVSVVSAGIAGAILLVHLVRRREVTATTRLWLLLGLGVLPIVTAGTANVAGFEATQSRKFCGSCHVMIPHAEDSGDPKSLSLAAVHARNEYFGQNNCYTCHKDYGMYGYVLTKMGGMRHVYLYLTEYRSMPLAESKTAIRILKPLPNANCMHCHTTTAPAWLAVPDHASSLESVKSGKLSCASVGCHGFAHPMTKLGRELELDGGARP
jgi:nitrate/TMAO reductase-like tetraheme cytochrome c subunit